MINLFNSKVYNLFINKLSFKRKKSKFLKLILTSWFNLKKKKLKPNILFFLILSKIRPIIYLIKVKRKKQKNKGKVKRIPKTLNFYNGYRKSVQFFLLPFFWIQEKTIGLIFF